MGIGEQFSKPETQLRASGGFLPREGGLEKGGSRRGWDMHPPAAAECSGGTTSKYSTLCKYHNTAEGCRKGDACPFIHQRPGDTVRPPGKGGSRGEAAHIKKKIQAICKFWQKPNGCDRGDACESLHEGPGRLSKLGRMANRELRAAAASAAAAEQPYANLHSPRNQHPPPDLLAAPKDLPQPSKDLPQPAKFLPQPPKDLPQPPVDLPQPPRVLPQPPKELPQPPAKDSTPQNPPHETMASSFGPVCIETQNSFSPPAFTAAPPAPGGAQTHQDVMEPNTAMPPAAADPAPAPAPSLPQLHHQDSGSSSSFGQSFNVAMAPDVKVTRLHTLTALHEEAPASAHTSRLHLDANNSLPQVSSFAPAAPLPPVESPAPPPPPPPAADSPLPEDDPNPSLPTDGSHPDGAAPDPPLPQGTPPPPPEDPPPNETPPTEPASIKPHHHLPNAYFQPTVQPQPNPMHAAPLHPYGPVFPNHNAAGVAPPHAYGLQTAGFGAGSCPHPQTLTIASDRTVPPWLSHSTPQEQAPFHQGSATLGAFNRGPTGMHHAGQMQYAATYPGNLPEVSTMVQEPSEELPSGV